MSVTLDTSLGTNSANGGVSTFSLTTSAAAAAGTRVIVVLSYFKSGGTKTPSGLTIGGVAATLDIRRTNTSDFLDIWSLHVAAGLPSGSTITATWPDSTGMGGRLIGAVSFAGIQSTAGYLDTSNTAVGTGTAWSSGSATSTGAGLFIGGAGNEDATNPTTSTPTVGTEIFDVYNVAAQQGMAVNYSIVASSTTQALTGNFSNANSTANSGALAIYKAAATATKAPPMPPSKARAVLLRR